MATFTVTTAADLVDAGDGKLSLREAVAQANGTTAADTIVFASGLEEKTLTLTGGELVLRQDVTIDGDQNDDGVGIALSGGDTQRILRTSGTGTDVALADLTLEDGRVHGSAQGGAIFVGGGTLSATGCILADNANDYDARVRGGAVYAAANTSLVIEDSRFVGNRSYGGGGGIAGGSGVSLTILDSQFSDNRGGYISSDYIGGAIALFERGTLRMQGSTLTSNVACSGGAIGLRDGRADIDHCTISGNRAGGEDYVRGGGIYAGNSLVTVTASEVSGNSAARGAYGGFGGGIFASTLVVRDSTIAGNSLPVVFKGFGAAIDGGDVSVYNSTISGNTISTEFDGGGGGIDASTLRIVNSTVTGNSIDGHDEPNNGPLSGGGIRALQSVEVVNSIIAGNSVEGPSSVAPDLSGTITFSNGHNIFGSDVAGNVSGDRENVAPSTVFAAIDDTGGGQLADSGIVPLLNSKANPAVSGADPLAAGATDQLGSARPLPAGSLPDLGSVELNQALSITASAYNDVLTGTRAANAISGLDGADYLKGLGGNDTLHGNNGGDLLDGGVGNDKLYGDAGIDLVFYGGTAKVKVDLGLATDKATRGSEVDTLYNVEGAIGSSASDTFIGNQYANSFQGGLGKDTFTGNGGRDLYDFNATADSPAGATSRDLLKDFAPGTDRIDLSGIDADTGAAGNQAFRWVGTAALTGPGEVGFVTDDGNTIIRASNDTDAASEFQIQLTGIKTLSAADFYL